MNFKKQLDPVGFPLTFGKKQMQMARVLASMTLKVFWALTKKKLSAYQASWCDQSETAKTVKNFGRTLMLSIPLLLARGHQMKTWPVILQEPRVELLSSHYCKTKGLGTRGQM